MTHFNPALRYAFLATSRLTYLIVVHYDDLIFDSISIKIYLYTDNKSVINKLSIMDEYPTTHLKTVMNLEWDML